VSGLYDYEVPSDTELMVWRSLGPRVQTNVSAHVRVLAVDDLRMVGYSSIVYSTTGIVYTWSYVVLVHDWMLLGSAAGYSSWSTLVLDARHSSVTVCWLMAIWMTDQCVSCGGCWMAICT